MKNNKTQKVIDYDKLNALSLYDKSLGEAYLEFDWDPLGPNFCLDLPFIEKYLQNAHDHDEFETPDFLKYGNCQVKECFKNALQNNIAMQKQIQDKFDMGEYADYKNTNIEEQVKDILFFLSCREQMLKVAIGQLKLPNFDSMKAYKNIYALNKKLSQLLEESYTKQFKQNVAINNMLLHAQREREKQLQKENAQQQIQQNKINLQYSGQKILTAANKTKSILKTFAHTVSHVIETVADMVK